MGYLLASLTGLTNVTKGYCGKKLSVYVNGYKDASFIYFIRMIICVVIGAILAVFQSAQLFSDIQPQMLTTSLLCGVSTAVSLVCWIIAVKSGALVLLDVFNMMGVGLTIACSVIFLGEKLKLTQVLGLAILLAATFIICSYNNSIKSKLKISALLVLAVCGMSDGITHFSQKLFVYQVKDGNAAVFNFYTYLFSCIVLFAAFLIFRKIEKPMREEKAKKDYGKIMIYVSVMAVALFATSYLKTLAAQYLSSVVLYPLSQGVTIILSMCMAAICFKEKITTKSIIGVILAIIALCIINLL